MIVLYCKMSWLGKFERIPKKNQMILYLFRQNVQVSWGQRSQFRGCWQNEWVEEGGFRARLTPLETPIRGSRLLRRCAGGLAVTGTFTQLLEKHCSSKSVQTFVLVWEQQDWF